MGTAGVVAIVVVTWLVFWMAQGFPTMCALATPCPGRDVRAGPALLFGGMMLAPLLAVILMSFVRSPTGWLIRLSYVVLVVLAIVGYGAVGFSGGFAVTAAFLAGLLVTCARRERSPMRELLPCDARPNTMTTGPISTDRGRDSSSEMSSENRIEKAHRVACNGSASGAAERVAAQALEHELGADQAHRQADARDGRRRPRSRGP